MPPARVQLPLRAVVALALSALPSAMAAEHWSPDQNSCGDQPSTAAIVGCLQGRTKFWDGRLNQALKALNGSLTIRDQKPRLAPLKAAQLAWLKYRDANCAFYASEDGTIAQVEAANCVLEMTQNRAIELQGQTEP